MTVIKNGTALISGELVKTDIRFDNGIITEIGADLNDDEVIDAAGLTILPGLVDVHVHLREPGREYKETIETGSLAAAHGGFTTIFAMPNVIPFPSTTETMKPYIEKLKKGHVRIFPYGTITDNEAGREVTDYEALKELGVRWFSDDGVGVADKDIMEQALKANALSDVLFACHTEDMNYRRPSASVHSSLDGQNGWLGIPSECESEQLKRDLELLKSTGGRYHACHISAKESVQAIREAKKLGLDVTGEVTVHHLLLEDCDVSGPNEKMNPPLRSHEDRMALIEGLEDGTLDFIANDHAPHSEEEKARPMDKAPFGIVSLETAFELLYTAFVATGRCTLPQLVNWMSMAPAKRFGLDDCGTIEVGRRADFVLIDEHLPHTIDKNTFLSKGKNTPFDGWPVACSIRQTICGGKTAWKGNAR